MIYKLIQKVHKCHRCPVLLTQGNGFDVWLHRSAKATPGISTSLPADFLIKL